MKMLTFIFNKSRPALRTLGTACSCLALLAAPAVAQTAAEAAETTPEAAETAADAPAPPPPAPLPPASGPVVEL
ncbi:MAG: hypothetical protein ACHQ53_19505, partial [Polyangiales bacterium]